MSASTRFKPGEGDWICGDEQCKNINFSKRTHCNKCGHAREGGTDYKKVGSEIGKQAAEKSKGLFSADDWMCKSCGNVNWARRVTCNICNQPKFNNLEPRTGYGGGYMERDEVVEYNRHDSDGEEYDEFGRKKKKKTRGPEQEEKPPIKDSEVVDDEEEEGEDEEDEEEGDDEDISKYNLDSEEDEEDGGDASKYDLNADDDVKPEKLRKSANSSASSSSRSSDSSGSGGRSRSGSPDSDKRHSRSRKRHRARTPSSSSSSSSSRSPKRSRRSRSRS